LFTTTLGGRHGKTSVLALSRAARGNEEITNQQHHPFRNEIQITRNSEPLWGELKKGYGEARQSTLSSHWDAKKEQGCLKKTPVGVAIDSEDAFNRTESREKITGGRTASSLRGSKRRHIENEEPTSSDQGSLKKHPSLLRYRQKETERRILSTTRKNYSSSAFEQGEGKGSRKGGSILGFILRLRRDREHTHITANTML